MRVFVGAFLIALVVSVVASSYVVEFNNNFDANLRKGNDDWDENELDDTASDDDDLTHYVVGLASKVSELDEDGTFKGFHAELVEAVAKEGDCKIDIIDLPRHDCLREETGTEVPFRVATELGIGVVDGCFDYYDIPELGLVAEVSKAYLEGGRVNLRTKDGKDLEDGATVEYPYSEGDGEQLMYRLQQLVGPKVTIHRSESDWDDLWDEINKGLTNGTIDGVYLRESSFDDLPDFTALSIADNSTLPGVGLLANWGRSGLVECFNNGLLEIMKSGKYTDICKKFDADIMADLGYDCIEVDEDSDTSVENSNLRST
jgi:ABC-type amino acid transport substrate-binding protein